MFPSGGLKWTKPCKNRYSVRVRVDPLGPIYPSIFFTGSEEVRRNQGNFDRRHDGRASVASLNFRIEKRVPFCGLYHPSRGLHCAILSEWLEVPANEESLREDFTWRVRKRTDRDSLAWNATDSMG
jgi:hypothetical protein